MNSSNLPEAVLSAIKSGDTSRIDDLYKSNISLAAIADEAASHAQPCILGWCYTQGWTHPRESFNSHFYICAMGGGIPIYQVLVDHGFDLKGHYTETCGDALSAALSSGDCDVVKWLLEHGHEATPSDGMHGSPSVWETVRADTPSLDMLKLLLEYGFDLKENGDGIGVIAADEGNLEALKLLLDRGVDVEDREMGGYPFDEERDEPEESRGTALYRACRQGHVECAKLLLDRGADARAKDDGGTSCLGIAKKRDHEDVVWLLEEVWGVKE
ncbi:ankyrin repeat-containing domain protein [Massariosphaeria phaeospora]|uniref:Ankyrin repeat-containing domain protein n=1 Tax=Massariosphaeria phaeospora TaxID=100035 RepID=A0A7C8IAK8_9PLEO|nr:ankyrin repeat-containing domain protein [Massariosphaeria phaeospora]